MNFNLYDIFMIPLEKLLLEKVRKKIIPYAYGNVLEIGIGTGANLKFYDMSLINQIIGTDPQLSKQIQSASFQKLNLQKCAAENLPFPDKHFDCVVSTLVLCSVESSEKAINEIKRVLKDDGTFIFIEHILPTVIPLKNFFNEVNSSWSKKCANCNLNRQTDIVISNTFSYVSIQKFGNTIFCCGTAKK